jgi:hypothetical protein
VRRFIAIAAIFAICTSMALAAPKGGKAPTGPKAAIPADGLALGVFLGQPTGFTFRLGLSQVQSFEAKAAWSLGSNSTSLQAEANWLIEFPGALVIEREQFIPYTGAGVALGIGSNSLGLGFRIPGGIVYRFSGAPIELALEVAIGMNLFPATSFAATGGLAIRYRF